MRLQQSKREEAFVPARASRAGTTLLDLLPDRPGVGRENTFAFLMLSPYNAGVMS